jgi:hypothetical protein
MSNNQNIICRYCWEPEAESTHKFLRPCACIDPICVPCLEKRATTMKKKTQCEICLKIISYRCLDNEPELIDPIHWLLMLPFQNSSTVKWFARQITFLLFLATILIFNFLPLYCIYLGITI